MNQFTGIGNLVRDPELRQVNTSNGPVDVCSFTIAVNRRNRGTTEQKDADFFSVTVWRGMAGACAKYLAKGRKVMVSGPISVRTYQDKEGNTRAVMEVAAQDVEFLSNGGSSNAATHETAAEQPAEVAGMQPVVTEELPF